MIPFAFRRKHGSHLISDRIGISYIVLLYPIKEAVAREPDRRVHKEAAVHIQSNAIKLIGRTFLAPQRGSSPKGNAIKLSKILIAHASNSVCFFHPLSLLVNNKIKKLVK